MPYKDPEKHRKWMREHYHRTKHRLLRGYRTVYQRKKAEDPNFEPKHRLKRFYGITIEQRDELFKLNGGLCQVCCKRTATHIDHCHSTGQIRGGLCHNCNAGIGMLGDTTEDVRKAYEYLLRNERQLNG